MSFCLRLTWSCLMLEMCWQDSMMLGTPCPLSRSFALSQQRVRLCWHWPEQMVSRWISLQIIVFLFTTQPYWRSIVNWISDCDHLLLQSNDLPRLQMLLELQARIFQAMLGHYSLSSTCKQLIWPSTCQQQQRARSWCPCSLCRTVERWN